ncbi:MAG: tRNA (adenosine(37)-N6)-threonylcarbamoyltransferase complex ATPase subunit type 1 TsaE [Rickettsiales bacterium]|jgi:tRNA threonylcarbamoyladenosine biosynthesis protein TsaE|nr:tRNA (adenosine(37)-N6)-threonylcarbamoyltransferase complex ATPase subunit type 1 TsaE [Rickettsiales bacterium]
MIYRSASEEDTIKIAEHIASHTKKGYMITLSGDLGSGKTFFARAFIKYFFPSRERAGLNVISPTFNIVKTYRSPSFTLYHLDLYRLKRIEELYELDLETIFQNVSVVEWPNLIYGLRPRESTLQIEIGFFEGNHREFTVEEPTLVL